MDYTTDWSTFYYYSYYYLSILIILEKIVMQAMMRHAILLVDIDFIRKWENERTRLTVFSKFDY